MKKLDEYQKVWNKRINKEYKKYKEYKLKEKNKHGI